MNEEGCGEDCYNRARHVECKREYCRAGDECSNMSISKKTPDKVRMEQDVLVATERVRGGRYLAQYTGEVVTREEMEDRVRSEYWPGQTLHVLPLATTAVVDATNKGGICRLASHSCSPNTEVVTWMVELDGEPRVCLAMYSLREIQEGESLSYDYSPQMELLKTRKPCNCGAKNCKKMLGASVSIMGPVQCTACQVMVLEDGVKKEVCLHPTLALPVCKSCKVKVELADWRKEQICRWCTRTEQVVISCSTCQSNFCRKCLNSNLGPGYIKLVASSLDNWTCLLCNSSPLDKPRSRLVSPHNKSEINPRIHKPRPQTIRPVRPITHRMTPGSTLSRGRPPTSRLLGRGAVSLRSLPVPSPSLLQPVRDEQTSRLLYYLQTRGINIQPVSHQVEIMHSVAEELEAAEIILHGIVSEARRQTKDGESSISKTKERVFEAIKDARVKLGQAEQKLY